jgi:dTDP-4-dehydrorhamnose reductase
MYQRILITGASGGLGHVLFAALSERYQVLGTCLHHPAPALQSLDLRDRAAVLAVCKTFKPDLIINTVAWTDVDGCEQDFARAFDLNVATAVSVRLAAQATGAKVMHISTNDIFSGTQPLWDETQVPQPLNVYARTKYMAEQVLSDLPGVLMLRFTFLSWWATGKTAFARWLVESLCQRQSVGLFTDQYNAPIYVGTLLEWLEQLWELEGVYHLASERRSRWDAGMAIAQGLGLDTRLVREASVHHSVLPAPRPVDVSLSAARLAAATGLQTTFAHEVQKLISHLPADLHARMNG